MKRLFTVYLCAVLAFVSCSKDDAELTGVGVQSYDVSIAPITTRATELNFESGDQIGVSITMNDEQETTFAQNSQLTYNSTSFKGDLMWYEDISTTSRITAYYPYVEGEGAPTTFSVLENQTTAEGYTTSDLMFASADDVTPTSGATSMIFNHMMSRIIVNIDNQSGADITSVKLCGSCPTALLDFEKMTVTMDESSSTIEIEALACDDGTYAAIIAPQSAALTFVVTLSSGAEIIDEKRSVSFISGGQYTANISIDEESSDIVAFEEYDNYFIYDGESYSFKTYSITGYGDLTIMTENMRYIPSGKSVSSDATDGSGLWYPYKLNIVEGHSISDDDFDQYEHTEAEALTDTESIKKYGYLYTLETAVNEELTRENFDLFEGAQGICPPGWHIPTKEELYQLSGDCISLSSITTAPFYNSSVYYPAIQTANDNGFNHVYPGSVTNNKYSQIIVTQDYTDSTTESIIGSNSTTYYMGSTANELFSEGSVNFANYFSLMTSHATAYLAKGKISVLYCTAPYGQSLRCVKDKTL